jgi:hypothetical protein
MYQSALNRSRSDKFILVVDIPKMLKDTYDRVLQSENRADSIQFTIFGSPVPDIKIPAIEIPYGGQVYKSSSLSRPSYNDLNIKFLVDNGYKNYWVLWKWLNLFNDFKQSKTKLTESINVPVLNDEPIYLKNPMVDFTSKISIFGIDEYNNKIISFSYTNAFPISLGEISFDNQTANEIVCNVSFAFNQLHVDLLKNVNDNLC